MTFKEQNELYKRYLFDEKIGYKARKYLKDRKIEKETIIKWELGFCPHQDNVYNKLENRITGPIYDQNGKIVSIFGRTILPNYKPKYDHYPFNARKVLFGLWLNKENIREKDYAIITEGQFDVIQATQKGVNNIVSSFGAHLSFFHIAILARYTKNIYLIYDNDNAGNNGAKSTLEFANKGDLNFKIKTILPSGEDIDSYLKCHTKDDFLNLLNDDTFSESNILKMKLNHLKRIENLL